MYITGPNFCEHDFTECPLGVVEFYRCLQNSVVLPLLLLHEWDVDGLRGEGSIVIDANVVVESFNDRGGRGFHNFVPIFGGDGTKIAPPGDLFDQPPGEMS